MRIEGPSNNERLLIVQQLSFKKRVLLGQKPAASRNGGQLNLNLKRRELMKDVLKELGMIQKSVPHSIQELLL